MGTSDSVIFNFHLRQSFNCRLWVVGCKSKWIQVPSHCRIGCSKLYHNIDGATRGSNLETCWWWKWSWCCSGSPKWHGWPEVILAHHSTPLWGKPALRGSRSWFECIVGRWIEYFEDLFNFPSIYSSRAIGIGGELAHLLQEGHHRLCSNYAGKQISHMCSHKLLLHTLTVSCSQAQTVSLASSNSSHYTLYLACFAHLIWHSFSLCHKINQSQTWRFNSDLLLNVL